jgi:septal ring factor EnvC (AmiA/AmiB activator)
MNEGGWVGVASLFVAGLFAWLNKRDSLRHDADVAAVKAQNAVQADQIAALTDETTACKEVRDELSQDLKACQEKHKSTELRIDQIEKTLQAARGQPAGSVR